MDDWPELAQLMADFAMSRDWSFRDSSEEEIGSYKTLHLSVCEERGVQISTADIRWALRHFANEVPGGGLGIALYSSAPEEVWHPAAIEFVRLLETHWPGHVAFKDPLGRLVDRPSFLSE